MKSEFGGEDPKEQKELDAFMGLEREMFDSLFERQVYVS